MKSKTILLTIPLIFCLCSCGLGNDKSSFDINDYEKYRTEIKYASEGLLSLEDIGEYTNVEFSYRHVTLLVLLDFTTDGIALFADYTKENYEVAIGKVNSYYSFINEPIVQEDGDYTFPLAEFTYKGYDFRISYTSGSVGYDQNKNEHVYPKSFVMVGFDNENSSLVFLYFYDSDLDLICNNKASEDEKLKAMTDLIDDSFYWRKE